MQVRLIIISRVVLYRRLVEVFKHHIVWPSLPDLRNLVGFLHRYLCWFDPIRNTQPLKSIRLHEQCECFSRNSFPCDLTAFDNTMWSGLQIPTTDYLRNLTQLKCQHFRWNRNSCHFSETILRVKSSIWLLDFNLFAVLVHVHGRSQSCQSSMIIVPTAPVSFNWSVFFIEWEVMKHSSNMSLPFSYDLCQVIFLISFHFFWNRWIDLSGQKSSSFNHELGKSFNIQLTTNILSNYMWGSSLIQTFPAIIEISSGV